MMGFVDSSAIADETMASSIYRRGTLGLGLGAIWTDCNPEPQMGQLGRTPLVSVYAVTGIAKSDQKHTIHRKSYVFGLKPTRRMRCRPKSI